MGDPEKDMNLLGVTIIVKCETAFLQQGPQMKPEKMAGLVILMGTGKKDHRG